LPSRCGLQAPGVFVLVGDPKDFETTISMGSRSDSEYWNIPSTSRHTNAPGQLLTFYLPSFSIARNHCLEYAFFVTTVVLTVLTSVRETPSVVFAHIDRQRAKIVAALNLGSMYLQGSVGACNAFPCNLSEIEHRVAHGFESVRVNTSETPYYLFFRVEGFRNVYPIQQLRAGSMHHPNTAILMASGN